MTGPIDAETRYAMPLRAEARADEGERKQPIYGLTLVSCEKGDIRQSPDGLYVYSAGGREELICSPFLDRAAELLKLRATVVDNQPALNDGRWGKATLEVLQGILESSRKRREIFLRHQVRCP
jgi:phthalate 4,5-cis-dihydrodiol dehydrogenase